MVEPCVIKAALDRRAVPLLRLARMAMTDVQFETFRKALLDELGWKGAAGELAGMLNGDALDTDWRGMGRPHAGRKGGAP